MSHNISWRPFPDTSRIARRLLIRYDIDDSSVAVLITDLRTVWAERLNSHGISQRAKEHNSPIDPDGGADQRRRLLEVVSEALEGKTGSTALLSKSRGEQGLLLLLSVQLPAPLPPLQWSHELVKQSPNCIFEEVTGPATEKLYRQEQDIETLTATLKDKDHVISRLFDRLEALSADLTSVFPGTSNVRLPKSGNARAQLGRYVRGLEPFDSHAWARSTTPLPNEDALDHVFSGTKPLESDSVCARLTIPIDLPETTQGAAEGSRMSPRPISPKSRSHVALIKSDSETESEDEGFQTQEPTSKDESIQTKQADSPPPISRPVASSHKHADGQNIRPKPRLGVIGGVGKTMTPGDHTRTSTDQATNTLAMNPSTSEMATDKVVSAGRKPKLGLIGGRKIEATNINPPAPLTEPTKHKDVKNEDSVENSRVAAGRGKADSPDSPRGRAVTKAERTNELPPPRDETSEDRALKADEKREQLKRQMAAATMNAGPKKKRRF